MRRILAVVLSVAFIATLVATAVTTVTPKRAEATPVSTNQESYMVNGRVFPDPHGCGVVDTTVAGFDGPISPFEKGNTCAVDFIQHDEAFPNGLKFLESMFPKFTRYYTLNKHFSCNGKREYTKEGGCDKFRSAGLPVTLDEQGDTFVRERRRLHMFRVTDEESNIPLKKRKWFVFPLSIHGIERAGVEGGIRAAEDLATWAACEANKAPDFVDCEAEKTHDDPKMPYPLMESTPGVSLGAGDAMKNAVVVFIFPNPDGWLRGDRFRDKIPSSSFYQRYNGNGVDLNRDWPTKGWTFRPYTPASEPETVAFGKVLRSLGPKDNNGDPRWAGGIDLHGQLIDRAFSFTLLGAGEFDYGRNQKILQTVKGAWRDAENRLEWSPLIKPNECEEGDVSPECPPGAIYGVQWGTVWDTIDYTITGGLGDWIGSPIGLQADVPIDNEMSLSHLSNCGIGTCFDPDVEQLHVDGNKSLIYGMINFGLKQEAKKFQTKGRVAYVKNPGFVSEKTDRLAPVPGFTKLPTQDPYMDQALTEMNNHTYEFEVKGPNSDPRVYNGGINAKLTGFVSPVNTEHEITRAMLERKVDKGDERPEDCDPDPSVDCWEVVNQYFLQGAGYNATGKALHANFPEPGQWRVRLTGSQTGFDLDVLFTKEKGWNDPGQIGFKATSMRFWQDLDKYSEHGVEPLTLSDIKNTNSWQTRYNNIVVTNRNYKEVAGKLKSWVAKHDGNLVLTDKAVGMLDSMGLVDGGIDSVDTYAGYINFETENEDPTYDDPSGLAKDVNQPGAAEGGQEEDDLIECDENHRHQIYEPVPIGIAIEDAGGSDQFNSPVWYVENASLAAAQGEPNAVGTTASACTSDMSNVSLGEIKYQGGSVRWIGALLPDPSKEFDNPFGVEDYAVTYSGYQVLKNALN
ncbi:MAG: hypothetical protein M3198_06775 [Actinomycetota bacterium]|nr:hypothetical protein [Actinomycetota bacterium]